MFLESTPFPSPCPQEITFYSGLLTTLSVMQINVAYVIVGFIASISIFLIALGLCIFVYFKDRSAKGMNRSVHISICSTIRLLTIPAYVPVLHGFAPAFLCSGDGLKNHIYFPTLDCSGNFLLIFRIVGIIFFILYSLLSLLIRLTYTDFSMKYQRFQSTRTFWPTLLQYLIETCLTVLCIFDAARLHLQYTSSPHVSFYNIVFSPSVSVVLPHVLFSLVCGLLLYFYIILFKPFYVRRGNAAFSLFASLLISLSIGSFFSMIPSLWPTTSSYKEPTSNPLVTIHVVFYALYICLFVSVNVLLPYFSHWLTEHSWIVFFTKEPLNGSEPTRKVRVPHLPILPEKLETYLRMNIDPRFSSLDSSPPMDSSDSMHSNSSTSPLIVDSPSGAHRPVGKQFDKRLFRHQNRILSNLSFFEYSHFFRHSPSMIAFVDVIYHYLSRYRHQDSPSMLISYALFTHAYGRKLKDNFPKIRSKRREMWSSMTNENKQSKKAISTSLVAGLSDDQEEADPFDDNQLEHAKFLQISNEMYHSHVITSPTYPYSDIDYFNGGGKEVPGLISLDEPTFTEVKPDGLRDAMRMLVNASQKHPLIWDMWIIYRCLNDWNAELTKEAHKNEAIVNAQVLRSKNADSKKRHKEIAKMAGSFGKVMKMDNLTNVTMEYSRQYDKLVESILTVLSKPSVDSLKLSAMVQRVLLMKQFATQGACLLMFTASYDANVITMKKRLARCEKNKGDGDDDVRSEKLQALDALLSYVLICECSQNEDQIRRDLAKNKDKERKKHCDNLTDSTQPTEQHRKVQKTLPLCVEQSDRAERLLTIIAELEDDNRIINEWAVTKKKKIEELKQLAKPNAQLPNHGMLDILKKQVEIGLGSPHGPRRTSLIQPLQLSSPRTVPPGGASPATPTLKTSPAGFLSNDTMKSPRRPSGLAHTLLPNQTNRARTNSIMSFGQALPGLMSPANFGPRDMQPQGWDFGDETNRSQQSPREVAPSPRGNRARLRRKSIGLTPNLISLMTGVHSTIEKDKEQIREYIQTESDNITTSEQELLSMIESRDYRRNKKLQELTMELANEYGLTQPTLANQEMLFQRLIDSSHQKPSPRFYSVWKQKAKGSRESQRVYYSFNVQLAVYVVSFLIFVFLTTGVLLTNVFFFDRNALRINIIHSLSEFAASVSQLNVNVRDLVSLTDSSFASPFNYTSIVSLTELIRTEREMVSKQMKLITNEQLPSSDPTIWRDRSIEMIVARPDDGTMSAQMSNSRWKTLINTIANSSTRNADFHSTPQTDITDTSFSNTPQASLDNITLILSSIPLSLYDSINAFTALSGELVDNILFSHNATSTEQVDPLFASSVTTILINGPTSLVEMIKHNMATIVEDQKDDVTVIILVFLIIFLFLGVVMVVSWIVTNVNSFKSLKTENRTNFDHLLNIFSYEEATIAITRRQALAANKNVPNPTDGCIKNPSSVEHIDFNLNPGPKPQQKLDVSPSPHSKTEPTLDIMDDSDPDTSEFSSTERSSSEDVEEVESEGSRTLNREASKALLNLRANKKEKKSPDTKLIRIPSSNSLFSFSSISSASSFVSDMSAQELDLRSEASAMPGKKINHSKSNATLNELPDDAAHTRPDMEDLARVSGTLPPVLKRSYFIMSITTAVIVILLIVFVVIWLCITYSSYSMDSPLSLIHSPASTDATNHYQVSLTSLIYITGQRWVGILTVKLLAQQFVFDRKPHILNKDDYFAPSASSVCGQGLCTSPIWLDTISSVAGSLNMLEHFVGNRSQLEILLGRGLTFLNSVNYVTRFGNQLLFSTDMDDDSGIPITQDSNIDKYQVRSIRSLYPSLSKLSRPHPSKPNQTITIESGMQELISHLRVLETSLDSSARDDGLTMAAFQYLYSDEYNELLELIEEEFNLLIDFVQQTTSRKQFAVITILLLSLLGVVVIGFACLFPAMTDFVRSSVNDEYVCKFAKSLGNAKLIQDERKQRRLVKERKKVRYLEKRLAQIERSKTRIPLLPDQETWSKFSKPRLETLIGSVCEEEKEDDVWDEKDADEEEELYHSNHQVILEDGLNSDSSKESGRRKANASTSSRDSS